MKMVDIVAYLNMNKVNPDNRNVSAIKFSIISFLTTVFNIIMPY